MPDEISKYLNKEGLEDYNEALPHSPTQVQEYVNDWLDEHPEATTTVQDGSITGVKIADNTIPDAKLVRTGGVLSATNALSLLNAENDPYSNLLNTNSVLAREGMYFVYTSGTASNNADYTSYIIPVVGGRKLSVCGLRWSHVTFYSKFVDVKNITASTVPEGFISGFTTGSAWKTEDVSIPSNATWIIVSLHTSEIPFSQVCYGSIAGSADRDPYGFERGKVDAATGKNILDLTSNAKRGIYVNGANGAVGNNSTYSACMVRVNAGDVLSFNSACRNAHVAFVGMWDDVSTYTAGTTIKTFISGFSNDAKQNFTVPAGATAMVFSWQNERTNLVQVEKAVASTDYEAYWRGVSIQKNVYGILPVGAGMRYVTISDAVAAAGPNDIVLVFPGTYNECVEAWGKYVNIIGTSRDECILTYGGGDYDNPPLEMSHGVLANMTIHTTSETQTGTNPAYCMHVEDSTAAGSSLYVSNVRFINDQHQTVGIGLRNNYTITFENCSFENNAGRNALYCHDYETVTTGLNNQNIHLINCSFRNSSPTNATIALQSQEIENNRATLLAQRCIVKNTAGGAEISMTKYGGRDQGGGNFLNSTDWLLDEMSALNTLAAINY